MKTELTTIDKLNKVLGREVAKTQINLATETLNEGEATLEAEVFAAGEPVMIVNEDERIPLPIGEYLLDNGMTLVVEEEGVIASIGEKPAEEEQEEEVAAGDNKTETPLPKAVIESIVKETKFSKEEIIEAVNGLEVDPKDAEITELKAKIAELEKVEEPTEEEIKLAKEKEDAEAEELELKVIKQNPENKKDKVFKLSTKGEKTTDQSIMSKIANLKHKN